MSRQERLRQLGPGLLYALLAVGGVWAGVGGGAGHAPLLAVGVWLVTLPMVVRLLLSRASPPVSAMMLSEAETQRPRAEVHAAMVTRRYDLARAKLQELAQRSRGRWPGLAQPPRAAPRYRPWWTALLWWRR
jgi:hypothetical protein